MSLIRTRLVRRCMKSISTPLHGTFIRLASFTSSFISAASSIQELTPKSECGFMLQSEVGTGAGCDDEHPLERHSLRCRCAHSSQPFAGRLLSDDLHIFHVYLLTAKPVINYSMVMLAMSSPAEGTDSP